MAVSLSQRTLALYDRPSSTFTAFTTCYSLQTCWQVVLVTTALLACCVWTQARMKLEVEKACGTGREVLETMLNVCSYVKDAAYHEYNKHW